jgi:hypothetical protein
MFVKAHVVKLFKILETFHVFVTLYCSHIHPVVKVSIISYLKQVKTLLLKQGG